MRLANGTFWPLSIVLDVTEEIARTLAPSGCLALRDPEGVMLAVLHVEGIWQPDAHQEAIALYGSPKSPLCDAGHHLDRVNPCYVGGWVEGIRCPSHYDFRALRANPAALRAEFARLG